MTTAEADLAAAITSYATRMHDVIGESHHVASPLGAWLLLALCGPATSGRERAELGSVLGADPDRAASIAADLLASPHPLVPAAAAVWNRSGLADQRWLAGLPSVVERGDIPAQRDLDEWASSHTGGLIRRFPIKVTDAVYLLLATVLATKVSWECPFDLAPGSALGESSPWSRQLARVLRTPEHPSHEAFIAATAEAGDVAVHTAAARGGLFVTSVIAAEGVVPADVLAAAHALATAQARGERLGRRSLFDLPLGDGPLWTVREEASSSGDKEQCSAVLPAWSAGSDHDLGDERLGFAAAAAALGKGDPWRAKQAATASFSRVGFEAAAVTAMAIMLSAVMPRSGRVRTAELRFGHPYAAVAVTADEAGRGQGSKAPGSAWNGVPVFSAWVADPSDASE